MRGLSVNFWRKLMSNCLRSLGTCPCRRDCWTSWESVRGEVIMGFYDVFEKGKIVEGREGKKCGISTDAYFFFAWRWTNCNAYLDCSRLLWPNQPEGIKSWEAWSIKSRHKYPLHFSCMFLPRSIMQNYSGRFPLFSERCETDQVSRLSFYREKQVSFELSMIIIGASDSGKKNYQ